MKDEKYSRYVARMGFVFGSPVSLLLHKMSQCDNDQERKALFNDKNLPGGGLTWAVGENSKENHVKYMTIRYFERLWNYDQD